MRILFQLFAIATVMASCQPGVGTNVQSTDTTLALANVYPQPLDEFARAEPGARLFSDREHVLADVPPFLSGAKYLVSSMSAGNRVVPVTEGRLLLVTPLDGFEGSQEALLTTQGFTRVDHPGFKLFEDQAVEVGIFEKNIAFEKFRLQDVHYEGWAVPFFTATALPSFTEPARIIWAPGKEYAKDTRLWQGCPSIEQTGKRLWGAWFSGGTREPDSGNYGIISYNDQGTGWVDPAMVIVHPDSNVRVMDPQLWTDPDGNLWVFWVQNTGAKGFDGVWGTWAVRIKNPEAEIPTWTTPKRLCNGLTRNKPIVLSSGEWLLPSYDWVNYQSAMYVSYDKGESWALQGGPINPPVRNFYEHMCVELKDGNIWMLQRNIQESVSANKGKDWTPLDTIQGLTSANSRLYIGRLRSGNLLLIYNDHEKIRKNLTAFLSEDEGKTWPYKLLLDERNDVSYPDVVESDDGLIHVCYDRGRREEKEILMAVFNEHDIVRGEFGSPRSVQQQIISKVGESLIGVTGK